VDRRSSVQGDVRHHTPREPGIDERADSDFHHVATQQEDHSPAFTVSGGDSIDDETEIVRGQNVR
jgi:hypothetical protein